MNTIEIDDYFKKCSKFYGTYPRDMLPKILPNDRGVVINTDESTSPGQHWVSVYKTPDGIPIYFDSFGLQPIHNDILTFIKENTYNGWYYNSINFQSVFSETCGLYCVYFLTNYFNGGSFNNFQRVFSFNPRINDNIAKILRKW